MELEHTTESKTPQRLDGTEAHNRAKDSTKNLTIGRLELWFLIFTIDERMYLYQRGRTSITGFGLEAWEIIETGRLVEVVMSRLVVPC